MKILIILFSVFVFFGAYSIGQYFSSSEEKNIKVIMKKTSAIEKQEELYKGLEKVYKHRSGMEVREIVAERPEWILQLAKLLTEESFENETEQKIEYLLTKNIALSPDLAMDNLKVLTKSLKNKPYEQSMLIRKMAQNPEIKSEVKKMLWDDLTNIPINNEADEHLSAEEIVFTSKYQTALTIMKDERELEQLTVEVLKNQQNPNIQREIAGTFMGNSSQDRVNDFVDEIGEEKLQKIFYLNRSLIRSPEGNYKLLNHFEEVYE